jgi:hypothetical protein
MAWSARPRTTRRAPGPPGNRRAIRANVRAGPGYEAERTGPRKLGKRSRGQQGSNGGTMERQPLVGAQLTVTLWSFPVKCRHFLLC